MIVIILNERRVEAQLACSSLGEQAQDEDLLKEIKPCLELIQEILSENN